MAVMYSPERLAEMIPGYGVSVPCATDVEVRTIHAMQLRIESRATGDTAHVELHGDVDVMTSSRLRDELLCHLRNGRLNITVDLCGVTYIDNTGLGALIGALRRCQEAGGGLILVCDNLRTLRIFEITGLTKVFTIRAPRAVV
jgi:anti-sigma B factor antagonist